ncbi:MAG: hypothetical protein H6835_06065 [Planctomycetes bacterium]|nr:hypothetical protein [Planctomycetota bacterium]
MISRLVPCIAAAVAVYVGEGAHAQLPVNAATLPAPADSYATESGGFLLSIPGVAGDFVLFGDGEWQLRPDDTARWTAVAQSAAAVDRDLFVELTFSGLLQPGDANHPPAGAPVTTLDAGAYTPLGPVDPSQWRYFTQVTGTITGLRAYDGARIDVANLGPAQVGDGATNKNALSGLACDLILTVVQAPTSASFAPTGAAQLRAMFAPDLSLCATHVDDDPQVSGTAGRTAMLLPGIADDYLWLPSGSWAESADGTATMTGTLQRQGDYADAWQLDLTLGGLTLPGDVSHPPVGAPDQQLLATIYAAQGGPIDPSHWRYYTTASGSLTGLGINDGGLVQLAAASAFQVGVGAAQGNQFFGVGGTLTVSLQQQPLARTVVATGDATLRANLATACILPPPMILTGNGQSIDNVGDAVLQFTGTDLGFVAQVALGPYILGDDQRRWFDGYFQVVDHETIEVSVPQALPASFYPMTMLNPTRSSNQIGVTLVEPATRTLATETERFVGEVQNLVVHQGDVQGFAFNLLLVSFSDQPSFAPGIVDLQIGAQFSDVQTLAVLVQDPVLHTSILSTQIPPILAGYTLHWQAALMDQTIFPLLPTNARSTQYL